MQKNVFFSCFFVFFVKKHEKNVFFRLFSTFFSSERFWSLFSKIGDFPKKFHGFAKTMKKGVQNRDFPKITKNHPFLTIFGPSGSQNWPIFGPFSLIKLINAKKGKK